MRQPPGPMRVAATSIRLDDHGASAVKIVMLASRPPGGNDHGYHVVLATDAIADPDPECHRHSVDRIFPKLGETTTSTEIIAFLDK